jgi:site-specific DNA recombinase
MEIVKKIVIAIYARVSGDKQKKEETIASQLNALRIYAKDKNYRIVEEWIFIDEGESGDTLDRPGLDALRDLVYKGGPDLIIMYAPDRIARKNWYQSFLLDEFNKAGVRVEFLNLKPAETPEDELSLNMLGAIAEYERHKILDRCRRGRLYKAKTGNLSIISKAPFGYINKKIGNIGTFEINSENSKIVREIFYLFTRQQYSLRAICTYLDSKNIPTPLNGKKWDRSTVRDILKNETYIGTAYFGKTENCESLSPNRIVRFKGKKLTKSRYARKERPKDLWIPMKVAGFINESDFQEAQELLERNKKSSSRNTKEPSLLQGVLLCQKCGNPFYKKKRGLTSTYCCSSTLNRNLTKCGTKSINLQELDAFVWNEILDLLKNPSTLENELARRIEKNKGSLEKHQREEKIEKELVQLSKSKNKLLDAYQEGDCITLDELRSRMDAIKVKTAELEIKLTEIKALKLQREKEIDIKASLEYIEIRLLSSPMELSMEEKQKVVRLLIEEILIGDDSIKIKHCVPPMENENRPLSCVGYAAPFGA